MSYPTLSIVNETESGKKDKFEFGKKDNTSNVTNVNNNDNFFADEFNIDVNKQSANNNVEIYGNFNKDDFDF